MLENKVRQLLEQAFKERQDLFLISTTISSDGHIQVVIDGDNGVLVNDCIYISRAVEHNLDRDEYDFSIEVTSSGATAPLTLSRQYKKHIGRVLQVKTDTGKLQGTLMQADEHNIQLQWKTREPKPVGKGKVTVTKQEQVSYKNIVEAKVMIKF